jgi:hypothetical protein
VIDAQRDVAEGTAELAPQPREALRPGRVVGDDRDHPSSLHAAPTLGAREAKHAAHVGGGDPRRITLALAGRGADRVKRGIAGERPGAGLRRGPTPGPASPAGSHGRGATARSPRPPTRAPRPRLRAGSSPRPGTPRRRRSTPPDSQFPGYADDQPPTPAETAPWACSQSATSPAPLRRATSSGVSPS